MPVRYIDRSERKPWPTLTAAEARALGAIGDAALKDETAPRRFVPMFRLPPLDGQYHVPALRETAEARGALPLWQKTGALS